MRITSQTRTNLRKIAAETRRYELLLLFSYYEDHGHEAPTQEGIRKDLGLSVRSIRLGTKALESVGFVKIEPAKRNRRAILPQNIAKTNATESSLVLDIYSSLENSSNLESRILDSRLECSRPGSVRFEDNEKNESKQMRSRTSHLKGYWSVENIREDEDWKKAEAILLKYFKPFQINPVYLTKKKNMFSNLIDLLERVDFDAYCKWYRVNKYPTKKFYYGLFLYPDMIAEFETDMEEDTYLNVTSKMENNSEYRESLDKQAKTLLVEFGDRDSEEETTRPDV